MSLMSVSDSAKVLFRSGRWAIKRAGIPEGRDAGLSKIVRGDRDHSAAGRLRGSAAKRS